MAGMSRGYKRKGCCEAGLDDGKEGGCMLGQRDS